MHVTSVPCLYKAVTPTAALLRYDRRMTLLNLHSPAEDEPQDNEFGVLTPLRTAGLAALTLGAVALGFVVGRELRFRYRFRRRTPSDYFSNAGDPIGAEYGMGI